MSARNAVDPVDLAGASSMPIWNTDNFVIRPPRLPISVAIGPRKASAMRTAAMGQANGAIMSDAPCVAAGA